ncbi:hypothetical protein L1887_52536 [Cichorium endivia]|nr:hypothetical protein L1887_52536 [Cichorium endivia]
MVNMMGSGIIMLPTKLAEVGTISIISWLVTAVGSMALAWAFAKCGMFSRKSGGMGGYAEYAFGKSGNFMANYTYGVSLLIANVAIAISAVGYGTELFGATLSPVQIGLATIGVLWICTVANFGGARITGQLSSITVWGVIIPVVGLCIIGWFWFSPTLYANSWNPHHVPFFTAVGSSIAMTLWAFLGLESACANAEVVENPEKNVPIAVLGGTLGAAVIYIVSTNVIAGIVPNMDLANSTAPFGLAFAQMFTPEVGKVIMGLMVMSCCGSLLGWQFTIAQVFKSSADEGYFPKIFSRVTKADAPPVQRAGQPGGGDEHHSVYSVDGSAGDHSEGGEGGSTQSACGQYRGADWGNLQLLCALLIRPGSDAVWRDGDLYGLDAVRSGIAEI